MCRIFQIFNTYIIIISEYSEYYLFFRELIESLQRKNVPVYLISGGFRGLIGPIAIELSIPLQHIYANKLKFFLNGNNN